MWRTSSRTSELLGTPKGGQLPWGCGAGTVGADQQASAVPAQFWCSDLGCLDRSEGTAVPVEMGMWRVDGDSPRRLSRGVLPSEAALEDLLEQDPSILGELLLVIGRQVRTPYGKLIDLLAMDVEGNLRVLELKRDRTPREVVAQVLDYGSWVTGLDRDRFIEIANDHLDVPFEEAFEQTFGDPPPEYLGSDVQLTIVATELDDSSERIVEYLRDFGVPVNAVFFAYLEDDGRSYLVRSWLASNSQASGAAPAKKPGKKPEWNGRDWFVIFGEGPHRAWEDARRYGFVSAGGGEWYSRNLRSLPEDARIFVYIPKRGRMTGGYVAVGETLGEAKPFDEALVQFEGQWVRLADRDDRIASYRHSEPGNAPTEDDTEYVVPVRWIVSVPMDEAYRVKGMTNYRSIAGRLRDPFTLERLTDHFGLDDETTA